MTMKSWGNGVFGQIKWGRPAPQLQWLVVSSSIHNSWSGDSWSPWEIPQTSPEPRQTPPEEWPQMSLQQDSSAGQGQLWCFWDRLRLWKQSSWSRSRTRTMTIGSNLLRTLHRKKSSASKLQQLKSSPMIAVYKPYEDLWSIDIFPRKNHIVIGCYWRLLEVIGVYWMLLEIIGDYLPSNLAIQLGAPRKLCFPRPVRPRFWSRSLHLRNKRHQSSHVCGAPGPPGCRSHV